MKKSIRFKIVCLVLPVVILSFVCVNLFCSRRLFQILQENIIKSEEQRLEQYTQHIAYMQRTTENLGKMIAVDDRFQKLCLGGGKPDIFQQNKQRKEIEELLKQYLLLRTDCYQITLVFPDGTYYSNRAQEINNYHQADWYQKFKSEERQQGYVELHEISIAYLKNRVEALTYVLSTRCISNLDEEFIDIVIEMNPEEFFGDFHIGDSCILGFELFNEAGYRLDERDQLSIPAKEALEADSSGGVRQCANGNILLVNRNMENKWLGAVEISRVRLENKIASSTQFITVIMIVSCIILLLILLEVILWIMKPVQKLMAASNQAGCGNLSIKVDIHSGDEFEELGNTFNIMTENLQTYIKKSVEQEKVKKDMEIDQLVLQINPHFIYNTLNTISYMAEDDGNERIEKFSNAFVALLQDSLAMSRDTYFTTFRQELKNLHNYILLQKYRYEDKIELRCQVPENLQDCRMPNIFLQPIVENAIFHGLLAKEGKGLILVTAEQKNQDLYVKVQDNGVGMSREKIDLIMKDQDLSAGDMRKIGAGNVKNRIAYIYGEAYGMEIKSELGKGTAVILHIPFENAL